MCNARGHRPDCTCGFGMPRSTDSPPRTVSKRTRRQPVSPTVASNGAAISPSSIGRTRTENPLRTTYHKFNECGLELLAAGEYDKAIVEFTAAIAIYSTHAIVYWNRGTAYYRKCDYVNAVIDYTKALYYASNPVASDYYWRGNAYQQLEYYDKAISDYNTAIQLNPKYIDAYNARGDAYRTCGKYGFALSDYTAALALDEHNKVARAGRRKVLEILEDKLVS